MLPTIRDAITEKNKQIKENLESEAKKIDGELRKALANLDSSEYRKYLDQNNKQFADEEIDRIRENKDVVKSITTDVLGKTEVTVIFKDRKAEVTATEKSTLVLKPSHDGRTFKDVTTTTRIFVYQTGTERPRWLLTNKKTPNKEIQ